MRHLFTIIISLCLSTTVISQGHHWVKQIGGPFSEVGNDNVVDDQGNVITVGYFEGAIDFDPGPAAVISFSNGQMDIFILKLDSDGNYLWHATIGNSAWDAARSVDVDDQGNIYVSGIFRNSTDFDPGPGVSTLPGSSNKKGFLLKLDAAGNYQWAIDIGSTNNDEAWDAIVDEDGNVYTTGWFYGTVDFDNGPGSAMLTSASGTGDGYTLKVNSSGNFVWVKKIGSNGWNAGRGLSLDGLGNLYTVGTFGSTVDFDPNAGVSNLTSNGLTDIFVQKLDTAGNFQWAYAAGSSGDEFAKGVTTDAAGNVYVTGQYSSTTDFDAAGTGLNLTSNGGLDIFVEKLDANGNFVWAQSIGGSSTDDATSIETDNNGNIFIGGVFRDVVDFDGGSGVSSLSAGSSEGAGYILKVKDDGSYGWTVPINNPNENDIVSGITLDSDGYIFATGYFNDTADFDPSSSVDTLTSNGNEDIFFWKIHGCSPSATSIVENICLGEAYVVPSGDETHTAAGVYNDTISNVFGCDSVLTITLNVDSLNYGVAYSNSSANILESTDTGATYQWLTFGAVDCSIGTVMPGETNQSLDLASLPNGYYGVVVSKGVCSDTTSCEWFGSANLSNKFKGSFRVYPNPSNGSFKVDLGGFYSYGTIVIYTIEGKEVYNQPFYSKESVNLNTRLKSGVYILHVRNSQVNQPIMLYIN